jgi:hypothetical protein
MTTTTKHLTRHAPPIIQAAFACYRWWNDIAGRRRFDDPPAGVGGIAELIVETCYPGMTKAPAGTRGYDFIDADGLRVSVKAWGTDSRTHNKAGDPSRYDRMIQLRIYDDGWEEINDVLIAQLNGATCVRRNTLAMLDETLSDRGSAAAFKPNATRGAEARKATTRKAHDARPVGAVV